MHMTAASSKVASGFRHSRNRSAFHSISSISAILLIAIGSIGFLISGSSVASASSSPSPTVETGPVYGRFFSDNAYSNNNGTGAFPTELCLGTQPITGCESPTSPDQTFSQIDFNPPPSTPAPPCTNSSSINVSTTTNPFTDVIEQANGTCSTDPVLSSVANNQLLSSGQNNDFAAVFEMNLTISEPGTIEFDVFADDGFIFGIGPSGGSQPTTTVASPTPPNTVDKGYPVMDAYNNAEGPTGHQFSVTFPAAGSYPAELDYTEVQGAELSLVLGVVSGSSVLPVTGTTAPIGAAAAQGISQGSVSRNPQPCQSGNDPVNCASGDFWSSHTDVSARGKGPGLSLTRTYNSLDARAGNADAFGAGWSTNLDRHLTLNPDGSVTFTDTDGSQTTAMATTINGSTTYAFPTWAESTLTSSGTSWTLVEHHRNTYTFDNTGRLTSIADPNGNAATLTYCDSGPCTVGTYTFSAGQLESVTDASGTRTIWFAYGTNGLVQSVTDPLGQVTTYAYVAGTNDLSSVTDPVGRVTSFTYYPGTNLIESIMRPTGVVVTNTYETDVYGIPDGVTAKQVVAAPSDPGGLTTTWSYTGDNFSPTGGTTTITDPHGNVEIQSYTDGSLEQITRGFGSASPATTTFAVCLPTAPATTCSANSATYQAGQRESVTVQSAAGPETTTYTYDQYGNELTVTDPMGRTTTYAGYNAFDEPQSVTDPMGITKSYVYDAYGNLTSQTLSPDATACGNQSPCANLTSSSDGGCPDFCGISVTAPQLFRRQPDRTCRV